MELKITKEKVLDAASKCSTAKATLKVLFPEVFIGEEGWEKLGNEIGKLINNCTEFSYHDIYNKIPGNFSEQKGQWIAQLIKSNLPKNG